MNQEPETLTIGDEVFSTPPAIIEEAPVEPEPVQFLPVPIRTKDKDVKVLAMAPAADGPCPQYMVTLLGEAEERMYPDGGIASVRRPTNAFALLFQRGGTIPNGLTDTAILAIVADRLNSVIEFGHGNRETVSAHKHVSKALEMLERRQP